MVVTFIVSLEYLQPKPPFKLGNQYSVHNAHSVALKSVNSKRDWVTKKATLLRAHNTT